MNAERIVRAAAEVKSMTITEVAEKFGTSQQNFGRRLSVGKFTLEEWQRIASALGGSLLFGIRIDDVEIKMINNSDELK